MISLRVRLVGDAKDHVFYGVQISSKISHAALRMELEKVTYISAHHQLLEFNGRELHDSPDIFETFSHCDEVIVKHSHLTDWYALLELEKTFDQASQPELKISIHNQSMELIDNLTNSLFFTVYASLISRCTKIEHKFFSYIDNQKSEAVQNSCRIHFTAEYGQNVKLTFNHREDGSRPGCVCMIEDGPITTKFFIKTQHGAESQSSNADARHDLDLTELFVYKFLEHLKMGAEVDFIENKSHLPRMIYIGSREIPGFKTLEFVEQTEPQNIETYSKCVVQMLFVYCVLMLGDHHNANMGVNGEGKPFIVDFTVIGRPSASAKEFCFKRVRKTKKFTDHMGTFDERLKISQDFLKESNFLNTFNSSVEYFLQHQKPLFDKSLPVVEKSQKTDDFVEYIENVRRNIQLFNEYSSI